MDHTLEINDLQGKMLVGKGDHTKKISDLQQKIQELQLRKRQREADLHKMLELQPRIPEVMGCAYIAPLSQVEYERHMGMKRDPEVEATAMKVAMEFELAEGRTPADVSAQYEGYDIKSTDQLLRNRYIEVKGRAYSDGVILSENEFCRLSQLGDDAWLYIVVNCATTPELFRIQNPGNTLHMVEKSKGVQYFVPLEEWKAKAI